MSLLSCAIVGAVCMVLGVLIGLAWAEHTLARAHLVLQLAKDQVERSRQALEEAQEVNARVRDRIEQLETTTGPTPEVES